MTAKWIDISQPLNERIAHWPGDTPFSYDLSFTKKETRSVNIGRITTSLHTGTHIDAPFHFESSAQTILDLDLSIFIGKARVIDVSHFRKIGAEQLQAFPLDKAERLLLKTLPISKPDTFPEEVIQLDPDLGPLLKEKNICLIGVDVPSVDALDSKEMAVHHSFHQHHIHILENIILDHVPPGDYELIALPLPIEGADGSPVRAVLRPLADPLGKEDVHVNP
ncbi:arylformamidase [Pseudobacillus wudalianchiensis]|uniref:Kynurenine formamidase n=1 Tax=Pseudobacillus wudalianchiensis TaxID=1743143 RepID=A0A1B9AXX2_9BACI|nr:arylformamidase [Bacillus wudalianchiensis]OCA88777.1 arylformamidase [Bacillus wudalianchiensis]